MQENVTCVSSLFFVSSSLFSPPKYFGRFGLRPPFPLQPLPLLLRISAALEKGVKLGARHSRHPQMTPSGLELLTRHCGTFATLASAESNATTALQRYSFSVPAYNTSSLYQQQHAAAVKRRKKKVVPVASYSSCRLALDSEILGRSTIFG